MTRHDFEPRRVGEPVREHEHGPDCEHPGGTHDPLRREAPKVGRNDMCPCGSGKKFKKCCGR